MRPIQNARLDKTRPVLILTRELVRPYLSNASDRSADHQHRPRPSTEVPVGPVNGLDHDSVVSCDNIVTVPTSTLGRHIGYLLPAQEAELAAAVRAAFDLQ